MTELEKQPDSSSPRSPRTTGQIPVHPAIPRATHHKHVTQRPRTHRRTRQQVRDHKTARERGQQLHGPGVSHSPPRASQHAAPLEHYASSYGCCVSLGKLTQVQVGHVPRADTDALPGQCRHFLCMSICLLWPNPALELYLKSSIINENNNNKISCLVDVQTCWISANSTP